MNVIHDYPLSQILYYGIGGRAKYVLEVQNYDDLKEAASFIRKNNINKIFIIGQGSNLLVSDEPFDGAVIRIVRESDNLIKETPDGLIEAFPGEPLDNLIKFGFENGYIGLEWAGGMPGTVGGAVRGNVGAFGGEIKDSFDHALLIKIDDGSEEKLGKDEFNFSYRNSFVKENKNYLILSCFFKLKKGSKEEIEEARQKYYSHIEYRKTNHPMEYPNCGSVFKNIINKDQIEKVFSVFPETKEFSENKWHGKVSVGYLIKKLGFSGFKIGQAQVSEKHNNFIINLGNAKFSDVYSIIESIKNKFFETFGFYPEIEIEIIK